jgi:8-oxo-dGTP diphosphatase
MTLARESLLAAEPIVEVAAAAIRRPDGRFLLAQRPQGRPYPGYWEFPGGKIEPGETPFRALTRELEEELAIVVRNASPWLARVHRYTHATVKLHFFRVEQWEGEITNREHDALAWEHIDAVSVSPLLPANAPILRALALPDVYAISNIAELGPDEFLRRLEAALGRGIRLLQFREKALPRSAADVLLAKVIARARSYGARVLLNGADTKRASRAGADGVHLTAAELMQAQGRPQTRLCGASCHDAEELAHAARLDLDFIVLGPVQPTLSHPGAPTLGWEKFSGLIRDYPLPVYAIGAMRSRDIATAMGCGAQGVAMMRAVWWSGTSSQSLSRIGSGGEGRDGSDSPGCSVSPAGMR